MERKGPRPPGLNSGRFLLLVSLAAWILWGPTELPAGRAPLEMDIKPGVSSKQVKYLKSAIQDVFKFFMVNYRINLHKTMRLIAAPNEQVYAGVLMKDFRMPGAKAQEMARQTGGVARESTDYYILVVKAKDSDSMADLLKTTCHEMVHWYQFREGGQQKTGQYSWITEGVANAIALYIVNAQIPGEYDRFRQHCLLVVKKSPTVPAFEKLDCRMNWHSAMEKGYGGVIYSKATLAVMELAERNGIKSLFEYFRHLRHQTPEKAFRMAFKVNLRDFQNEMDQKFR